MRRPHDRKQLSVELQIESLRTKVAELEAQAREGGREPPPDVKDAIERAKATIRKGEAKLSRAKSLKG